VLLLLRLLLISELLHNLVIVRVLTLIFTDNLFLIIFYFCS